MIALRRLPLILSVFSLTACGDVMTTYWKSVSTTAVLAKTCRETVSAAHEKVTADVKVKADAGDKVGAKADLDKWLPVYDKAKKTCEGVKAVAEEAIAAAPVVEAAVTKKTDAFAWIARLAKLGFDTVTVLAEAGIKIPGGK